MWEYLLQSWRSDGCSMQSWSNNDYTSLHGTSHMSPLPGDILCASSCRCLPRCIALLIMIWPLSAYLLKSPLPSSRTPFTDLFRPASAAQKTSEMDRDIQQSGTIRDSNDMLLRHVLGARTHMRGRKWLWVCGGWGEAGEGVRLHKRNPASLSLRYSWTMQHSK